MATRDWDSAIPNLPRSTAENLKVFDNDYYTRDDIRAVGPPIVIMDTQKNDDLEIGDDTSGVELKKGKTPGKVYKYSDRNSTDPAL